MPEIENNNETKKCGYPGCTNIILVDSQFQYCEVCRILSIRNAHMYLTDPSCPIADRSAMIFHQAISLQKPDETLNAIRKLEWLYLEYQKIAHAPEMEEHRRARFQAGMDEVNEERKKSTTPKLQKKRESKNDKLKAMLGERVNEIMGGDLNDL